MKKYEYERIIYGGVLCSKLEGHREIIDRRAAQGWRYGGWVPVEQNSHGVIQAISLIFEKDVEE